MLSPSFVLLLTRIDDASPLRQALTSSPREVAMFYHSDALMASPTDVDLLAHSASALDGDRPVPSSRASLSRSSFSHSVDGACNNAAVEFLE